MRKLFTNIGTLALGLIFTFTMETTAQIQGSWQELTFLKPGDWVDPGIASNWKSLDITQVNAIVKHDGWYYIGGLFVEINQEGQSVDQGKDTYRHLIRVKFSGNPGTVVVEGLGEFDGEVKALQVVDGMIWAVGGFRNIKTNQGTMLNVNRISYFDPTKNDGEGRWYKITDENEGVGFLPNDGSRVIYAFKVTDNHIYVGGGNWGDHDDFGQCFQYYARANGASDWNEGSWHTAGKGIHGKKNNEDFRIRAIEVDGAGNVYVGGYFEEVDNVTDEQGTILEHGVVCNNIAKWNGSTWSALNDGEAAGVSGMGGSTTFSQPWVLALHYDTSAELLYIGGGFKDAGSETGAYNLATWNGESFGKISKGVDKQVHVINQDGNYLYFGGEFNVERKDDEGLWRIARWDGTEFSTWGKGVNGSVAAVKTMLPEGDKLFIGGSFEGTYQADGAGAGNRGISFWNKVDASSSIDVNSLTEQAVVVYPNPSSGIVNLAMNLPSRQDINVQVVSVDGSVISSSYYTNVDVVSDVLDLSKMENGIYFIQIKGESNVIVKRVVLSK